MPSAIVKCAITASGSRWYGNSANIAVCPPAAGATHRTRVTFAARAGRDDEVVFILSYRLDDTGDQIAAVGAIAVHERDDPAIDRRRRAAGHARP